jgi:hypothetical protein
LSIPAHSTALLEITQALSGEAMALILDSAPYVEGDEPQPITAALVVTGDDMASVAAQPVLTGGQLVPIVKDASLAVTNSGTEQATVALAFQDADGLATTSTEVQVNPGVTVIPLGAESGAVQVTVQGGDVRVVLVVPQVGETAGLSFAPLGSGGASGLNVQIGYDPTLG